MGTATAIAPSTVLLIEKEEMIVSCTPRGARIV